MKISPDIPVILYAGYSKKIPDESGRKYFLSMQVIMNPDSSL